MRRTIRLDAGLLREAEALAVRTGRTLTSLIEDALREALAREPGVVRSGRAEVPVHRGKGLLPGVDLDSSTALLELMELPAAP